MPSFGSQSPVLGGARDGFAQQPKSAAELQTYLPRMLLRTLVAKAGRRGTSPSASASSSATAPMHDLRAGFTEDKAVVMFVDVTGFSEVANRLSRTTSAGAELLTRHLNAYFSKLIDVVAAHGGDILVFSGDALVVAWPACTAAAAELCLRCGDALLCQASLYTFSFSAWMRTEDGGRGTLTTPGPQPSAVPAPERNETIRMSLHLGAACGSVSAHVLGGAAAAALGRWKFLVVGRCVEAAGLGANLGTPGQFHATADLVELAASRLACYGSYVDAPVDGSSSLVSYLHVKSVKAAENVSPPFDLQAAGVSVVPQVDSEGMSGFLLDTLVSNRASDCQLRTVSTVFIKLLGVSLDLSAAEMHGVLDTAVRAIQKALKRVRGVLNKVVMDDKGVICICLFGIPGHSHEDDAERSAAFAAKVARKFDRDLGTVAVGIARANVFCGITGSATRREYTVLGDGVNLAARLMSLAEQSGADSKSRVICDRETANIVASTAKDATLTFSDAAEVVIKGRPTPVLCYALQAPLDDVEAAIARSSTVSPQQSFLNTPVAGDLVRPFKQVGLVRGRIRSSTVSLGLSSCSSYGSLFSAPSVVSLASVKGSAGKRNMHRRSSPRALHKTDSDVLGSDIMGLLDTCSDSFASPHIATIGSHLGAEQPLVGRDSEEETLQTFFEGSVPGRCLRIVGEHQAGKSRMLKRAKELAAQRGHATVLLCATDGEQGSFAALRDAMAPFVDEYFAKSVYRSASTTDAEPMLGWLRYVSTHPRLPAHPPHPDSPLSVAGQAKGCCAGLLWFLRRMLSTEQVVFLLDDQHLADSATLAFLHHAVVVDAACALVCSQRDGVAQRRPRRGGGSRRASGDGSRSSGDTNGSLIELEGLPSDPEAAFAALCGDDNADVQVLRLRRLCFEASVEQIRALLVVEPEPWLSAEIYRKACGNCGYTASLVSHLILSDQIKTALVQACLSVPGGRLTDAVVHHVTGVEAAALQRRDELPHQVSEAVNVASVLLCTSQPCPLWILTGCLDELYGRAAAVDASIAAFVAAPKGIVQVEDGAVSFCHPLYRDAVYSSVLLSKKEEYHAAAAGLLRKKLVGSSIRLCSRDGEALYLHATEARSAPAFEECYAAFAHAHASGRLRDAIAYLTVACEATVGDGPVAAVVNEVCLQALTAYDGAGPGRTVEYPAAHFDKLLRSARQKRPASSMRGEMRAPGTSRSRTLKRQKPGLFSCCCGGGESNNGPDDEASPVSGKSDASPSTRYAEQRLPAFVRRRTLQLQCEAAFNTGSRESLARTVCKMKDSTPEDVPLPPYVRASLLMLGSTASGDNPSEPVFSGVPASEVEVLAVMSAREASRLIKDALFATPPSWPDAHTTLRNIGSCAVPRLLVSDVGLRPALLCMSAVCLLLQGDVGYLAPLDEVRARSCSQRWATLAWFIRIAATQFVHDRVCRDCMVRKSFDVVSPKSSLLSKGSRSDEAEINTNDVVLAPLVAVTQTANLVEALSELKAQCSVFLTPYHALSLVVLADRASLGHGCTLSHEDVADLLALLSQVCPRRKKRTCFSHNNTQAQSHYPLYEPCCLWYEGLHKGEEAKPAGAVPYFESCVKAAAQTGTLQSVFAWKAR